MDFLTNYGPKYFLDAGGQIVASRDIPCGLRVKKGDLGGQVQTDNLSHLGLCWVYSGMVSSSSIIDSATVYGNLINGSIIKDESTIENSTIENSTVAGTSTIKNSQCHDMTTNDTTVTNSKINNSSLIKSSINYSYIINSFIQNTDITGLALKDAHITDPRDIQKVGTIANREFLIYYRGKNLSLGASFINSERPFHQEENLSDLDIGFAEDAMKFAKAMNIKELVCNFDKEDTSQQSGTSRQEDRITEYMEMVQVAILRLQQWRQASPEDRYLGTEQPVGKSPEVNERPAPHSF